MKRLLIILCLSAVMPFAVCAVDTSPVPSPDQAEAVKGNNAFAVELYGQLKNQPGNLFFSPESISTALAMTYAGARGNTATEMANTLHFMLPPEKLHPAMGALLRDRNAAHDGYQLKEADALWGQQGYTFLDDFLKLDKDNYGAGMNQVDFKGATETARNTINQWVEQQTENKITDLIAPGVMDMKTRLVLTNAIYFKGDWEVPFKKEDTKDEDFHLSATQTVKARLMHRIGGFNYYENSTFQALEIPYKNKELSMIVFLPKDANGLPAFEQTLTADNMRQWLTQLQPYPELFVTIPNFNIEKQFGLNDILQAMGMNQAFGEADFSGMTGKRDLFITAVIHEAKVDVNEQGTEAAAATAVTGMRPTLMMSPPPAPPVIVRANHPFTFLIRDNRSGGIIFVGRVIDPAE